MTVVSIYLSITRIAKQKYLHDCTKQCPRRALIRETQRRDMSIRVLTWCNKMTASSPQVTDRVATCV